NSIQKPLISPVFRSFHISGSYCSQEPTRNTPAFLIPSTVRPSACAPAAAVSEARPTQAARAIALIVFIYASLCSSCFTETTAAGGLRAAPCGDLERSQFGSAATGRPNLRADSCTGIRLCPALGLTDPTVRHGARLV